LPFLQGKMEFGDMYPSPNVCCSKPIKVAEPGDVLISVRAPVGDVNLAPYNLCIGRGLAALRFNREVAHPLFYFYYLQKIKSFLEALSKGSTFKAINKDDLRNLFVPLPPLWEQRAIAEVLSGVDDAIRRVDLAIAKTERLKKGLMQKLLTEGIGHKEFKQTKIGKIPKDWKIIKLDDYAYIKGRIGWRGLKASEYTKEGPYLVANKHIINGKVMWDICDHLSEFRYEESPEIQLRRNDVIMAKDGTIGEAAIIDFLPDKATINSTMMLIRTTNNDLAPKFMLYFLQGPHFKRFIYQKTSGTSIPHIFQRDMKNLRMPLPQLSEQKRIVEILSTVDRKLELERARKVKLERVKKGLMNDLLTGKRRVKAAM